MNKIPKSYPSGYTVSFRRNGMFNNLAWAVSKIDPGRIAAADFRRYVGSAD
jgi:hypothetical protein